MRDQSAVGHAHPTYRQTILDKPTYGHPGPAPKKPALRIVLLEWFDAVNFWRDRTRLIPASYAAYHFATFAIFIWFLVTHFSIASLVSVVVIACFISSVYNTVWYHRYCSHQAFRFRSIWFARVFLWTNPVCFREESYVIPHRLHHAKSDEPGDPYGPHLGWLGSYLATETQQKTNRDLAAAEYNRLVNRLAHIGLVTNNHDKYRCTGSVEKAWCYVARVITAHLVW